MNKTKQTPTSTQIIAQTEYKVFNVSHRVVASNLDYSTRNLTWLPNSMKMRGMEGISLQQFEEKLNSHKKDTKGDQKITNSGILKGLFSGGFSGEHCTVTTPFLFFDIDVKDTDKPKDNRHLLNPANNQKIFEAMKLISIAAWKSLSGNGIAGILYVPQIAQYTNDTAHRHRTVGMHITAYISNYLHEETGVDRVVFDEAQSKFRQVRMVAPQKGLVRRLNPTPFVFEYTSKVVEKKTPLGVVKYRFSDYRQPNNSIFSQFNNDNQILDMLLSHGFKVVSSNSKKIRVRHSASESSTSGYVDVYANTYVNFSSSFDASGKGVFSPSDMVCKVNFNNDWKAFAKHLHEKGYNNRELTQQEIKNTSKTLKAKLGGVGNEDEANKLIFEHCFELKHASIETKKQFIAKNCPRNQYKKYFYAHLNLVDYTIQYDKRLTIKEYVSEVLHSVLEYADEHQKVLLRADTGKGKTTAFIKYFRKYRPHNRILILAPLTIIVDEYSKKHEDCAVFLTGLSDGFEHEKATIAKTVFSTYEQGIKHLAGQEFDYIIIDEVHQLLTANSFKADVIADLTTLIASKKIIGLTGTPSQIFTQLGYKLLNVDVDKPTLMKGEARLSNKSVGDIVMSHLAERPQGKVLVRVNSISSIIALRDELVQRKMFTMDATHIFYSSKEIKESVEYKQLAHQSKFSDQKKIVFTTSMIDEGISIDQLGFTDVLFIENSYHPRPEPIKQFFARFRNTDPNRKNYLYLHHKNLQTPTHFMPEEMFEKDLETLINESNNQEASDVLTTFNSIFSNNSYYYKNATTNNYYLAYSVTQVLFSRLNIEQFLDYLESNYFLSFKINDTHAVEKHNLNDKAYKKSLKHQIAKHWVQDQPQIYQALLHHSQSPHITHGIHKQQISVAPNLMQLVRENINIFEDLYLRSISLKKLGVEKPLNELIIKDGGEFSLLSNTKYKHLENVLKVEQAKNKPLNNADKRIANQFSHISQWCVDKKEFKLQQLYDQIRALGVVNYKAYCNEEVLTIILKKSFNVELKRNNRKRSITCKKLCEIKTDNSIRI